MRIKEAMNKGVITVGLNTTPIEAFEKMYKEGIRRLFVMDEAGSPKGVVSYFDVIGILGSLKPSSENKSSLKIEDIMSTNIMTISTEDNIEDAANLMVRADVSGLLVLEDGKPAGVITKTDVCRLVAAEILVPLN
ncbi:MAG TPA: CBS domain-containing protein [Methanobacterium sp.]|jgi:predicted transcriptional regulator|nr:MAG: CBS domain-containing protein [Methanobacterium sp.]HOI71620.1 CBS domain-containing protein [Methanobacterium sp.]HPX77735.1 CBS domain-containing protein [Methanobacterium sp.]